jgi:hypothetical protein
MINFVPRTQSAVASAPPVPRKARMEMRGFNAPDVARDRMWGEVRLEVPQSTTPTMQRDVDAVPGPRTWSPPV